MRKKKALLLVIIFFVALFSLYFRFHNLQHHFMYHDVGYELEAARLINQNKELPLIGPEVGVRNVFIPPTYLYFIALIYFINPNPIFMTAVFAAMSFFVTMIIAYLIYRLTSNKYIAILSYIALSVWNYLIKTAVIWHPHPVLFFLSLSLLFSFFSFKNKKLRFLILSQLLFFISLSIYPSPIFFLPIIISVTYHFFKNKSDKLRSLFLTFFSLFSSFFIVYLPQIIFEFNNHFPTINYFFAPSNNNFNFNLLKFVEIINKFFDIFFPLNIINSPILPFIFFLFFIALFFLYRNSEKGFSKLLINSYFLFWILLILIFIMDLKIQVPHRFDVLGILFFIILANAMSRINRAKLSCLKILSLIVVFLFFLFFLISNFLALKVRLNYKSIGSINASEKIASLIVNKLKLENLPRESVIVFRNYEKNIDLNKVNEYLEKSKWSAERVDHFINREFPQTNRLTDDYQKFLNYYQDLNYLDADYYFLICDNNLASQEGRECLDRLIYSLEKIDEQKIYNFIIKEDFFILEPAVDPLHIFFIEKQQKFFMIGKNELK